jgi:hypothetical protein
MSGVSNIRAASIFRRAFSKSFNNKFPGVKQSHQGRNTTVAEVKCLIRVFACVLASRDEPTKIVVFGICLFYYFTGSIEHKNYSLSQSELVQNQNCLKL